MQVIARAQGPGVDPPGQSGCGMRCMGAWLARGTREGVHDLTNTADHQPPLLRRCDGCAREAAPLEAQ